MDPHRAEIRDLEQLIAGVTNASAALPEGQLWFRGHRDATWKLQPKIFRDDCDSDREHSYLTEFKLEAGVRHANCPTEEDDAAWLALMQHYGLPTRLLDWTLSPLTAAWFAVAARRDDATPATIWGLFPYYLNAATTDQEVLWPLSRCTPLLDAAFDSDSKQDIVVAVRAPVIDQRMLVQQSCFTIHGTPTPLEERAFPGTPEHADPFLIRYDIPPECINTILAQLTRCSVSRRSLFPDLANLAQCIATPPPFSRPTPAKGS